MKKYINFDTLIGASGGELPKQKFTIEDRKQMYLRHIATNTRTTTFLCIGIFFLLFFILIILIIKL